MSSKCRKILTDFGFRDGDAESIIDNLSNIESVKQYAKEIHSKINAKERIRTSQKISEERTRETIDSLHESVLNNQKPFKSIWNLLVGKSGLWINANSRSEARNARVLKEMNLLNREMATLLDDDTFVKDLLKEMYPFNGIQKTKNKEAFKLAKILTEEKKLQVTESNAFGGAVFWRDDHLTATWHDPVRMLGKGLPEDKQIWISDIISMLDKEKTLSNISIKKLGDKDLEDVLSEMFDSITQQRKEYVKSGRISKIGKALGETFERKTPLKDYLEAQRILVFKDVDSIIHYNEKYGYYNIGKSIFANMDQMDNHLAMGEVLGFGYSDKIKAPDGTTTTQNILPEKEIDTLIDKLYEQTKLSNFERWKLKSALYQVSGESFIVGNPSLAKFTVGWQAWQTVTKLGKQMISSFGDLWSGAINLHYQGVKPGTAYLGLVNHLYKNAFQKIPKKEKVEILRMLGVGFDGVFGSSARSVMSTPIAGKLSRMQDHFLTWNGSHGWTNWMREGFAMMSSNHFANQIMSKNFNNLDTRFAKLMKEYGITEKDWAKLKEIGTFNEKDFRIEGDSKTNYISGDWIRTKKGPESLARKLDKFFILEAKYGVPEATGAERAMMYGSFNRGTIPDTATHLFWEFRTHTMSIVMNTYPRMAEIGMPSVVHLLPAVGLGYASLAAKNMLKGKEPPAYDDPEVLTDALVQSGFAGVFGDFLAGEYGRYHHKWDEATLGAGYATFKDYGELFVGLTTGNKDAGDVWKNLRYNIPYANLFYTEAAINYGLHYGVMETFSPGYLNTLESRAEANEEAFMLEPSNIWGYGGLR
jgi:hypothetical protein